MVTIFRSARPGAERSERDRQIGRIDAQARQRAARPQHPQGALERALRAQRLDRDVDAAPVGEAHDLLDRIDVREVDHVVGAHASRHLPAAPARVSTRDDGRGAASLAPAVAQRPIGPCANTATASPMRTLPLSAPEKPVDMMSGHISTCSSVSPSGTGAGWPSRPARARIPPGSRRSCCRTSSRRSA